MKRRAFGGRFVMALGLAGILGLPGVAAAQSASPEVKKDAERAGQKIEQGAEKAGQKAEQGAEKAGQKAEQAGKDVKRSAEGQKQPLSDAWLTAKVKLALLADEEVSGTSINVDTSGGVVDLKGQVKNQQEKAKAIQVAKSIEGVKTVRDHLTVASTQPAGAPQSGAATPAKRDDEQIAREVRQQIQETLRTRQLRADGDTLKGPQGTSIEVKVDDGVVTLEGKVSDVQDIVKAAEAARRVQGVRSVKTNIESGQRS